MPIPGSLPASPPSGQNVDGGAYIAQSGLATGNVYYVQSSSYNARDVGGSNGLTPQIPFKTLNFALSMCTPNENDRIYVLPGHVETVNAAAALTFATGSADGVTVIFEGNEIDRGSINFTTSTAAQVTITANNVTLINARFTNAIDALVAGIAISGTDCKLYNTQYLDAASTASVIQVLTTNAAKRLTIVGYYYYEASAGTTKTEAIRIVGGDHHRLSNLSIMGTFSTAVINNITTATTYMLSTAWNLTNLSNGIPDTVFLSTSTFVGGDVSPAAISAGGEVVASKILALPASATTQTVFTVAGGPVEVTYLGGLVTTTIGSTATTLKFSTVNTIGTLDLCTAGTITSLAVNVPVLCVTSTGTALNVAGTAGVTPIAAATLPMNQFVMAPGTIIITTSANAGGGAFQYFMRYRPLGANITVA